MAHLETLIADEHLTATGKPEDWANESHNDAKSAWLTDGSQVDDSYYKKEISVVDERLALAGLRLAAALNAVFFSVQAQMRHSRHFNHDGHLRAACSRKPRADGDAGITAENSRT